MNEAEVKRMVQSYLKAELPDGFIVKAGEIHVPHTPYRADVVVYDGHVPVFGVECKTGDDLRMAIGQASTYAAALGKGGIAAPEIDNLHQTAAAFSGLSMFETGTNVVRELASPPNPDALHATQQWLDEEVYQDLMTHVGEREWLEAKEYVQTVVRRALE